MLKLVVIRSGSRTVSDTNKVTTCAAHQPKFGCEIVDQNCRSALTCLEFSWQSSEDFIVEFRAMIFVDTFMDRSKPYHWNFGVASEMSSLHVIVMLAVSLRVIICLTPKVPNLYGGRELSTFGGLQHASFPFHPPEIIFRRPA